MARERNQAKAVSERRFGNEIDVELLTSISRRTLQKDRLFKNNRFPWYKVGRAVLYDLGEVEEIIRASRSDVGVREKFNAC
jgi:hypothetical protein